ncbi:hypothetical protein, partial [Telluribacter sp. SYSU D00476]|uniref:hypothetical protein n=1 Tax=Telluribacter sp. SYSU D00476 TaxID=2811430 RepID=UPI001FF5A668
GSDKLAGGRSSLNSSILPQEGSCILYGLIHASIVQRVEAPLLNVTDTPASGANHGWEPG